MTVYLYKELKTFARPKFENIQLLSHFVFVQVELDKLKFNQFMKLSYANKKTQKFEKETKSVR